MLFDTVKKSTRPYHDKMESLIGSHRLSGFSLEDYRLLVATNYVFHASLEKAVEPCLTEEKREQLRFSDRKKTGALTKELSQVGITHRQFQVSEIELDDYPTALGWMYVAEGSMLGGKYIHKILLGNPSVASCASFDLYLLYGNQTGKLWGQLKEEILQSCGDSEKERKFMAGVKNAYQFFEQSFHLAQETLQGSYVERMS